MCGIAGILDLALETDPRRLGSTVASMADVLRHRGPDDGGTWVDLDAGVALGHRRLAVIDPSPTGRQPMVSRCGRYVLVYNGEIYNGTELRRELEGGGHRFRGHSDTEVLLEACAEWGVEKAVPRLYGMFAFALWDRQSRVLTLVRDRLGIKPLYWGYFGSLFLFGSELKALCAHPGWHPEIDREALGIYICRKYVPAPRSIYRNVFKLIPGHVLTMASDGRPAITRYWDLNAIAQAASAERANLDEGGAIERLHALLLDAVRRRMVADVPLGAFLSGGTDSSAVVALMQTQSEKAVKTFTVGFEEQRYDEAQYAEAVARRLGTEHTVLRVGPACALETIPQLPRWYDEPFADSSQIPTLLLSELTRRHVTVALSGEGGDEVFGGYERYFRAERLRRMLGWAPAGGRRGAAALLRTLSSGWEGAGRFAPLCLGSGFGAPALRAFAGMLAEKDEGGLYWRLVSNVDDMAVLASPAGSPRVAPVDEPPAVELSEFMERMSYLDLVTSLPDDILTKVDRASMAVGLEARVPLLDHRVVEFVWQLPPSIKFEGKESKPVLRRILDRYLPRELFQRPKMGFRVPVRSWLRGPLREWAEELLAERRLREEGFFDPLSIRVKWNQHAAGQADWHQLLWRVLMFQAWRTHWDACGHRLTREPSAVTQDARTGGASARP